MDRGIRRQLGGYGGGGAGDRSVISPIMLRFRPIAPKPADGEPFPGASPAGAELPRRRVKRKYRVRVRRKKNNYDGISNGGSEGVDGGVGSGAAGTTETLQLLPAREEDQESAGGGSDGQDQKEVRGGWVEEVGGDIKIGGGDLGASGRAVVESRVTLESVGSACIGDAGGSLGSTDEEVVRSLEVDTCPAFVTDSVNRVIWVNAAYMGLVTGGGGGGGGGGGVEVRVELAAAKEELPWWRASFTCQVRVEHTWRDGRYSKLVPCDVWRLGWGGFAWRLDVKAALSLGF